MPPVHILAPGRSAAERPKVRPPMGLQYPRAGLLPSSAMPSLPTLPDSVELTLRIVLIVVAALLAFGVLRTAVRLGVRHLMERRSAETEEGVLPRAELERRISTIGRLLVRVAGAVIGVIAALMVLGAVGIDIGPAVAGLGVVGIAVGLGAQTLVKDWLAGLFVVLENQFSQGDLVRIVGVEGTVEDFSLRRTLLRDADGSLHSVPNGQIIVASRLSRPGGGQGEASTADEGASEPD